MQAVARRSRCVGAAAAVAVGAAAVAPVVPGVRQFAAAPAVNVVNRAVQLTADGDSLLNIPFNLFQQIVNIPNTEVEAMNVLASSLLYTGTWFTPSATNVWGEDPADPGHFMGLVDMLIPFKEISGLGSPEIDPEALAAGTAGLGQQLAMLAAAELPSNAACDLECSPLHPTSPITGAFIIDFTLWSLALLTGVQKQPLIEGWNQVPLSELTSGYTFPTAVSPISGVGPGGAVPGDDVFGFPGTTTGPDGENLLPWSNLTFTLNPLGPVENFYNSLLAPPDISAFVFPTFEEMGRALQALAAGMVVDFYPFVPGSPECWGQCDLPDFLSATGIVQAIGDVWPGNPLIDHWLALTAEGTANAPTQDQVDFAIQFLQGSQTLFDFGNPLPSEPIPGVETPVTFDVSPVMLNLIDFMKDTGVQDFVQMIADWAHYVPAF